MHINTPTSKKDFFFSQKVYYNNPNLIYLRFLSFEDLPRNQRKEKHIAKSEIQIKFKKKKRRERRILQGN